MTLLYIIGIILLIGVLFVGWGIFGWILSAIGSVFELIFEGVEAGCGCIFSTIGGIIIAFFVIGAILALFGINII